MTGQAKTDQGSSQTHTVFLKKRLLLFRPDFTYLFLLHPKAVPNTEQTHIYTATGVNIAFPCLLRLHIERLHSL